MATAVGLNMKITADTAGIGRGMNRTEKALAGLKRSTDQAASALRGLVAIEVGKILASTFSRAADAALGMANRLRGTIDETAKLAQRTGIAVEALQGFQIAAGLSGVNNFTEAISKLSVKIAQAGQGNKDVQQTLERLNLSFEQLEAMSPEDRFKAVGAAIQGLPNEMERAAAAVKLFEEGGIQLLPLFAQNLEKVQARAERLGIVLSRDQTKAIEDMNDALFLVGRTFDGIIGQVTANLAPIVSEITEEFLQFVEAFEGFNGVQGGNAIADFITDALLGGISGFLKVLQSIGDSLITFGEAVGNTILFIRNLTGGVQQERIRLQQELQDALARRRGAELGSPEERVADREVTRLGQQLRQLEQGFDANGVREAFARSIDVAIVATERARAGVQERLQNDAAAQVPDENPLVARLLEAGRGFVQQGRGLVNQAGGFLGDALKQAKDFGAELLKEQERRNREVQRLNEQYAEKSTEIEASRLDTLSRANQNALEASDIRSGGISQFLALATGREDPAVAEARAQRRELEKISAEIRRLGGTVEIVGAA